MELLTKFFLEFIRLSIEMSIWLMLGFLFAGILHVFINRETIARLIGKSDFKSIFTAAMLGVPLPLCSCGVIPTALAIQKNGASKSSTISFLIATPQTGVDSIFATYSLLGLPFAIVRPIAALVTGILGGYASKFFISEETAQPPVTQKTDTASEPKKFSLKAVFSYGFVEFMDDLSKWLLIGLSLAAVISIAIPDDFFQSNFNSPILQMLAVLAVAIPTYVCATGSIPIAMALMMKGLSPGAALVFLMAGPAINIASITVIGKALGRKALIAYIGAIATGAMVAGLLIDYLLPAGMFALPANHMEHAEHHHQLVPYWIEQLAAIILGVLLVSSLLRKSGIIKKIQKMNFSFENQETVQLKVTGMSCNHCVMTVEKTLKKLDNIEFVEADFSAETVKITGKNVDLSKVQSEIEQLGYTCLGKV